MREFHKTSNIQRVDYYEECSLTPKLVKGEGTRQMVYTLLKYLKEHYEWIQSFSLTDNSTIKCQGHDVPLAFLSLASNGSTWYTKYFKAELKSLEHRAIYERNIVKLRDAGYKNQISYDMFLTLCNLKGTEIEGLMLQDVYEKSSSFVDFYTQMQNIYPRTADVPFCRIFFMINSNGKQWGPTFVSHVLELPSSVIYGDWLVNVDNLDMSVVEYDLREVNNTAIPENKVLPNLFAGGFATQKQLSRKNRQLVSRTAKQKSCK
jgi:hypothetical protein